MKIAYIVPSLINQGPIIVVHNLVAYLMDKVEAIEVFYFDAIDSPLHFPCPTTQITFRHPIDFNKFDIIHSHCLRPDLYVWFWRSHIKQSVTITTLHQDTEVSLRFQYNKYLAKLVTQLWLHIQKKFNGITTISNQLKEKHNPLLNNNITLIYNGCHLNKEQPKDPFIAQAIAEFTNQHQKIIGSYAFLTKGKGLHQIIEALQSLSDYGLIIIGEGPELVNLQAQVERYHLSKQVLFLPYTPSPFIYLPSFDIYVMASYSEGFGLAMVEAALSHTAIVCSDIPSFHELFTDTEVCFFQLDSIPTLCQAIQKAYKAKDTYAQKAYNKAVSSFTMDIMGENYHQYYQQLYSTHILSK